MPLTARLIAALVLACGVLAPVPGLAQTPGDAPAPLAGCYRFAFGAWDPPLDSVPRPLPGDPATPANLWDFTASDSVLLIFPAWWPVGVQVRVDRTRATGDTLHGTATAYVSDGRWRAPTSRARIWKAPCSSGRPTPRAVPSYR